MLIGDLLTNHVLAGPKQFLREILRNDNRVLVREDMVRISLNEVIGEDIEIIRAHMVALGLHIMIIDAQGETADPGGRCEIPHPGAS